MQFPSLFVLMPFKSCYGICIEILVLVRHLESSSAPRYPEAEVSVETTNFTA